MGVFTAVALAIHNIPEGVATFTGKENKKSIETLNVFHLVVTIIGQKLLLILQYYLWCVGPFASKKLGASIAVAIGIHNIPEGFAISVPLYFGTGKKWQSFFYSVLTGRTQYIFL